VRYLTLLIDLVRYDKLRIALQADAQTLIYATRPDTSHWHQPKT